MGTGQKILKHYEALSSSHYRWWNLNFLGKDDFSVSYTGVLEEKIRVHPTGDEPVTFWFLVQMIYH